MTSTDGTPGVGPLRPLRPQISPMVSWSLELGKPCYTKQKCCAKRTSDSTMSFLSQCRLIASKLAGPLLLCSGADVALFQQPGC
jgi:hypothetical protein